MYPKIDTLASYGEKDLCQQGYLRLVTPIMAIFLFHFPISEVGVNLGVGEDAPC